MTLDLEDGLIILGGEEVFMTNKVVPINDSVIKSLTNKVDDLESMLFRVLNKIAKVNWKSHEIEMSVCLDEETVNWFLKMTEECTDIPARQ